MYRINAVGKDGKAVVLGTAHTATQALHYVRDAIGDYPRAWVTDEYDHDVAWAEVVRRAKDEQAQGS